MMRPGWRYESVRHALAARGISTGRRYNGIASGLASASAKLVSKAKLAAIDAKIASELAARNAARSSMVKILGRGGAIGAAGAGAAGIGVSQQLPVAVGHTYTTSIQNELSKLSPGVHEFGGVNVTVLGKSANIIPRQASVARIIPENMSFGGGGMVRGVRPIGESAMNVAPSYPSTFAVQQVGKDVQVWQPSSLGQSPEFRLAVFRNEPSRAYWVPPATFEGEVVRNASGSWVPGSYGSKVVMR